MVLWYLTVWCLLACVGVQVLMKTVALRRTKDMSVGGRPLVSLPPKSVHHVPVELSKQDRDKYKA